MSVVCNERNGFVFTCCRYSSRKKEKSQQLHNYKKGDIIKLGKCAGLPVEWTVLDTEATRVLLLANDILDVKPYDGLSLKKRHGLKAHFVSI